MQNHELRARLLLGSVAAMQDVRLMAVSSLVICIAMTAQCNSSGNMPAKLVSAII